MLRQIECSISGRVQGMFYRAFARRTAKNLGLFGMVENLPDGTVHLIVQGDQSILEQYIFQLKRGNMFSRVDSVDVRWSNTERTFSDFSIQ